MKHKRLNVAIIFGGRSAEHEVSVVSAQSIVKALDPQRFKPILIGITKKGEWLVEKKGINLLCKGKKIKNLKSKTFLPPDPTEKSLVAVNKIDELSGKRVIPKIDVIFPILHGPYGEDGTIQGLFEMANVPFVGSGVLASALGMDKITQKQIYIQEKLPTAKFIWFLRNFVKEKPNAVILKTEKLIGYPCFVKPANLGSSIGVTKAHDRKELVYAVKLACAYDRKILIEKAIKDAREIKVSIIGNDSPKASVCGEVISNNEFYDYNAKYMDGKSKFIIPAKLPSSVAQKVRKIAIKAYKLLDCSGMARVDFLVTEKTNKIFLNEINTIPGFTSISMYPKLWEKSGISYKKLITILIELGLERWKDKQENQTSFDSNLLKREN